MYSNFTLDLFSAIAHFFSIYLCKFIELVALAQNLIFLEKKVSSFAVV